MPYTSLILYCSTHARTHALTVSLLLTGHDDKSHSINNFLSAFLDTEANNALYKISEQQVVKRKTTQ